MNSKIDSKTKRLIQSIIRHKIPKKCVFDAHSLIEYLIQHHSDIYLSLHKNSWTTKFYHSEISRTIDDLRGDLIKKIGESWSLNIHKKFTENSCWKKL
jgi:hypothetical protein